MTPFSGIITPESMSFTTPDGKVHNVNSEHGNFEEIRETIKELQRNLRAGDQATADEFHHKLTDLVDVGQKITNAGEGRVVVRNGVVEYDGEAVNNAIAGRILWGLSEGFDMKPYMAFLDNIMQNPSKRAADETFGFIEANKMGITDDGHILAYKRVTEKFMDIYTGKIDNSPGKIVEMRRNKVDDDKNRTCSYGLHFCSMAYLPSYGAGPGNTIVIVKVNPRDVVSIPTDYNNAKARTCRYEVLGEYTGTDKDDILGRKAVWNDTEFRDGGEDEFDGSCPECGDEIEEHMAFCPSCGVELPNWEDADHGFFDEGFDDEDEDEDDSDEPEAADEDDDMIVITQAPTIPPGGYSLIDTDSFYPSICGGAGDDIIIFSNGVADLFIDPLLTDPVLGDDDSELEAVEAEVEALIEGETIAAPALSVGQALGMTNTPEVEEMTRLKTIMETGGAVVGEPVEELMPPEGQHPTDVEDIARFKEIVEEHSGKETVESLVTSRIETAVRDALSGLGSVLTEIDRMRDGGDDDAGC